MKVLIAEDDLTTRKLLEATLSKFGYFVVSACDGKEAWEILQQDDAPRLAVLDWIMPNIDGIELCRKLKGSKRKAYTYTILLTSKTEKKDVVTGLESGADDFITKPFDLNELKSRLVVGVRMVEYEAMLSEKTSQLERYATQMESLAEKRAKQLVHADRMATLGVMSAGIAHEIKNPLTIISSNAQLIQKFWEKIETSFYENNKGYGEKGDKLKFILEQMPATINELRSGVVRINRIVNGLGVYARKDEERILCSINKCIEVALELCHNILKYNVTVEKQFDGGLPDIKVNQQEIEQVFINLFVNAAHAMESQGKGNIKIMTGRRDRLLFIVVEDTGPGISEDMIKKIWDPFFTTKTVGKGTGLGLLISRQIIKNHSGVIRAENKLDKGARFVVELPCQGDKEVNPS